VTHVVDTDEPVNPVQVEAALREIANRIAKGVKVVDERLRAYKQAKREYDQAFARAVLAADGAVALKKYRAVIETADLAEKVDIAETSLSYARETAKALEKELDALRSIGASTRAMYGTAGV
jgi:16S rRNA G527 N7-methylase RsmG